MSKSRFGRRSWKIIKVSKKGKKKVIRCISAISAREARSYLPPNQRNSVIIE